MHSCYSTKSEDSQEPLLNRTANRTLFKHGTTENPVNHSSLWTEKISLAELLRHVLRMPLATQYEVESDGEVKLKEMVVFAICSFNILIFHILQKYMIV